MYLHLREIIISPIIRHTSKTIIATYLQMKILINIVRRFYPKILIMYILIHQTNFTETKYFKLHISHLSRLHLAILLLFSIVLHHITARYNFTSQFLLRNQCDYFNSISSLTSSDEEKYEFKLEQNRSAKNFPTVQFF